MRQVKTNCMDRGHDRHFIDDITAALDWWRMAGVDCDFVDEPREWIVPDEKPGDRRPARRPPPAQPAEPVAPTRIEPGSLPADLDSFRAWWADNAVLADGGATGRVSPQGNAGAEFMVIVETPEMDDRDALLAGPQGQLLDAILRAFGTKRDDVYLASALPRFDPVPDWRDAKDRGVGQALARHIEIVAPKRVITLGGNILPLLGHGTPQRAAVSTQFDHEGQSIPLLAGWGLAALLNNPRAKANLWKAWLDWDGR